MSSQRNRPAWRSSANLKVLRRSQGLRLESTGADKTLSSTRPRSPERASRSSAAGFFNGPSDRLALLLRERARTRPALGPGRAGCHRGIAGSAFGRCSGRKAKKRSKWEHFCPHCWRTYQPNIPPKQLPRMKRTRCWIPAQVNVRTSVARLNYKRSTARQGRSPLYLHGMRLFSPELPC